MSDHTDHNSNHASPADIIPEGSWQDKLLISCAIVALLGLGSVGYGFDIGGIQVAHAQENEQGNTAAPAESNSNPTQADGANAGAEGATNSQPPAEGQGDGSQPQPAPAPEPAPAE